MDALLSLDLSEGVQYSDTVGALEAQKIYQLIGDYEQLPLNSDRRRCRPGARRTHLLLLPAASRGDQRLFFKMPRHLNKDF